MITIDVETFQKICGSGPRHISRSKNIFGLHDSSLEGLRHPPTLVAEQHADLLSGDRTKN